MDYRVVKLFAKKKHKELKVSLIQDLVQTP